MQPRSGQAPVIAPSPSAVAAHPRAGLAPVDISENTNSIATDVNAAGRVVGLADNLAVIFNPITALTSPSGSPEIAQRVSTQGYIAGWGIQSGVQRAFVTNPGSVVWLPPLVPNGISSANDVNDAGHVVGFVDDVSGELKATFWNSALFASNLGQPGIFSLASAINNADVVVGYQVLSGVITPTQWGAGTGTTVVMPMLPGSTNAFPNDIDNNGFAVGRSDNHAVLWLPDATGIVDLILTAKRAAEARPLRSPRRPVVK
ncbi:MAG: hypothetical protein U0132_09800 [Gemmatimonadaceae bacterium]